jgi:hypothetical protein
VYKGLQERKTIVPLSEDSEIRREIKRVITKELKISEDIDQFVCNKLESYSKKIYEGSDEWEVLYKKFYNEEVSKRGRG